MKDQPPIITDYSPYTSHCSARGEGTTAAIQHIILKKKKNPAYKKPFLKTTQYAASRHTTRGQSHSHEYSATAMPAVASHPQTTFGPNEILWKSRPQGKVLILIPVPG